MRLPRYMFAPVLAIAAMLTSCSSGGNGGGRGDPQPVPVATSVELSQADWDSMRFGERLSVTAQVFDQSGQLMPGADIVWTSTDPAVARVDADGLVTSLAAGSATIQATSGAISESLEVSTESGIPSASGDMYTVWPARSDAVPVHMYDGLLRYGTKDPYDSPLNPGCFTTSFNGNAATCKTPWPYGSVEKFVWKGDYLGLLTDVADGVGTLRLFSRAREQEDLVIADAVDFDIEPQRSDGNGFDPVRIAVIGPGGRVRVKDDIDATWVEIVESGAVEVQLEADRIGVMLDNDQFRAKDGTFGEWVELVNGADSFKLSGIRIAALRQSGELIVKDGLFGDWETLVSSGIEQYDISANLIGVRQSNGDFRVKDGIFGAWEVLVAGSAVDIELEGNRIGVIHDNGLAEAKDGIFGDWVTLASSDALEIAFTDNFIGVLTLPPGSSGQLVTKQGLFGVPRVTATNAAEITQFEPMVKVPSPPARITPAEYRVNQDFCIEQKATGFLCAPVAELAPLAITPVYGRWCGKNVPQDNTYADNWGPIDPFDELCVHHDKSPALYPDDTDGAFNACVVRYGIEYARLSRNGFAIADSTATWDQIWTTMPNLLDVVENYNWYTSGCEIGKLKQFEKDTAAPY